MLCPPRQPRRYPPDKLKQAFIINYSFNSTLLPLTFRKTIVAASLLRGEVVAVAFASVVLERLTRLGVDVEVVAGDASATAADTDIAGLTADVVLGGTAKTLRLVDGAGPGSDRGAVVGRWALSIRCARSRCAVLLLPYFSAVRTTYCTIELFSRCSAYLLPSYFQRDSSLCNLAGWRSCSSCRRSR